MDDEIKSCNERQMRKSIYIPVKDAFLKCLFISICTSFMHVTAFAQSERKLVREGNQMYKDKKFSDAEVNYKKSLDVNKESKTAQFNLGDAYYKQGKFDDATKQFETISADSKIDKEDKARAYHNLGNSYLQSKKYNESINAYKNALKLNPKDNDTRYNLAYAQSMIQQQQQQQQKNQDKDKKDKNDEKKDQQQQQQEQKDQQQKEDQKKDEQKQAKRDKISKEDAEKILQALNNDEKNTQKKLTKKDATKISIDKNW
jgi:Ca-activated chloride channel family protein